MTVETYLKKIDPRYEVTFIKARARADAHSPFYHAEYQTTPLYYVNEWLGFNNERILKSVVLNDKQMPIDWLSGACWGNMVKIGRAKCLLIVSEEDFKLLYKSEEQRVGMEKFIEERLFNQ